MHVKDVVPAPIGLALVAGGFPLIRALFGGDNLALAAVAAVLAAALAYLISRHLLSRMGLPVTATLSDVAAARRRAKANRP